MKNIMIISTLTILTSAAMAQDYCSNLNREQARLADCQRNLEAVAIQVSENERGIRMTERDINNQGKRDRALNECRAEKTQKKNLTEALIEANSKADNRIAKVNGHNSDIARQIGSRLVVKHECAAIYPETGNQVQYDRGDWGRFVGKKAIFFGEGATAEAAKNNLLAEATNQGFFDKKGRGGLLGLGSRTADKRRKKLLTSLTCFAVYNKDHAQSIKADVEKVANEALKVKMPQIKVAGGATVDTPSTDGRRGERRNRRGNRRGN